MKISVRRTALTSLAILFLLGGTTTAFANTQSTQTLSANMAGEVTNLGTQVYSVGGGQVLGVMVGGTPVDPSSFSLQFNLVASQSGLTTRGFATVRVTGNAGGVPVGLSGTFNVNGNVPGGELPLGCLTDCTSDAPLMFVGSTSSAQVTYGATQRTPETLYIESPYWNPFGAPILLATADGAIEIVATYSQASILWVGAQVQGYIAGTLGTQAVNGGFAMTTNEYENLVTGTASDLGTIQFSTNISALNAKGIYAGTDTIPTAGSSDCATIFGLPEGTCTVTGFQSHGTFRMNGVTGTYSTEWTAPAIAFSSTVSATVSVAGTSQQQHH